MKTKFSVLAGLAVLWVWTSIVASVVAHPNGVVWRNLSPYVWFFQGVPVEATYTPTPVQSVSHVTCTIGSADPTFPAVNLSYSVIAMTGSGITGNTTSNMSAFHALVLFVTATSAHCYGGVTGAVNAFDVIAFVPSLLKHAVVRDLQVIVPPGIGTVGDVSTGYTVTLSKSLAFYQGCQVNSQQSTNQVSFNMRQINATTIRVEKQFSDNGYQCAVGMAEFK